MTRLAPLPILFLAGCSAVQPLPLASPVVPTVAVVPREAQALIKGECEAIPPTLELLDDVEGLVPEIDPKTTARADVEALAERAHELARQLSPRLLCGLVVPDWIRGRDEARCIASEKQCREVEMLRSPEP